MPVQTLENYMQKSLLCVSLLRGLFLAHFSVMKDTKGREGGLFSELNASYAGNPTCSCQCDQEMVVCVYSHYKAVMMG